MKILNSIYDLIKSTKNFSSKKYWSERYGSGNNSGPGSYGHLAEFKAEILNNFTKKNDIQSVIEFGCGDGNQLLLTKYKSYTGIDISDKAIEICKGKFANDNSKNFILLEDYKSQTADLAISLDVIFHLVEDRVFEDYMKRLFGASNKFVIIYSSDTDELGPAAHVRHRKFTRWIEENHPNWELLEKILNRYPYNGDYTATSFCDFYIYTNNATAAVTK